jgi:hypothetical protein
MYSYVILLLILIIYWWAELSQQYVGELLPQLRWKYAGDILVDLIILHGPPAMIHRAEGGTAIWAGAIFTKLVLTDRAIKPLCGYFPMRWGYGFGEWVMMDEVARQRQLAVLKKRGDFSLLASNGGTRGGTLVANGWGELLGAMAAVIDVLEYGVPKRGDAAMDIPRSADIPDVLTYMTTV